MKQWIRKWMAAACIAAFSTLAAADTIAGLYAGAGIWSAGPGGNIGGTAVDVDALGLSSETNAFVYVALEYPVPALPHVKLQHTRLSSRGEGLLSRRFRLDDVEFFAGETVSTELDLTHIDAVMYYELLDNVVSLDLGGTLRVFNGHARVSGRSDTHLRSGHRGHRRVSVRGDGRTHASVLAAYARPPPPRHVVFALLWLDSRSASAPRPRKPDFIRSRCCRATISASITRADSCPVFDQFVEPCQSTATLRRPERRCSFLAERIRGRVSSPVGIRLHCASHAAT